MDSSPVQIASFPVKSLPTRYDVGRAAIYNRLHQLNIKPFSVSNKAFITDEELIIMDQFHTHLSNGFTAKEFPFYSLGSPTDILQDSPSNASVTSNRTDGQYEIQYTRQDELDNQLTLFLETIKEVASALKLTPNTDLKDLENLEAISANNWLLPTKRLAAIIGISPSTLSRVSPLNYCGFTLTRTAKQGRSHVWRVTKT